MQKLPTMMPVDTTNVIPVGKLVLVPIAAVVVTIILVVAHSPPIHAGATALWQGDLTPPNPLECSIGTCWDRATKYGFHPCTSGSGQVVRGVTIMPGSETCYRSIFINLEPNTGIAFFVLVLFVVFTARMAEHVFDVMLLKCTLRWSVFVAICFSLFPWFYSWAMVFIYINEFRRTMLISQLFFTLTESFVVFVLVAHASRDFLHRQLLLVASGTALSHACQNAMDELLGRSNPNHKRNVFLIAGDIAVLSCSIAILGKRGNAIAAWRTRILIALGEILIFQLFFADEASFSFLW